MFSSVTLRGPRGAIVWASRPAAELTGWMVKVAKDDKQQRVWTLRARIARVDAFSIKQTPLVFTAPRIAQPKGLWCWPVIPASIAMAGHTLTARLGPPEGQ